MNPRKANACYFCLLFSRSYPMADAADAKLRSQIVNVDTAASAKALADIITATVTSIVNTINEIPDSAPDTSQPAKNEG